MLTNTENRQQLSLGHIGRLYRVAEAAQILSIAEHTLRCWISEGRVGVIRFGKRVRVPETELYRLTSSGWQPAEKG
jgi:excisionase family DNA binding protein